MCCASLAPDFFSYVKNFVVLSFSEFFTYFTYKMCYLSPYILFLTDFSLHYQKYILIPSMLLWEEVRWDSRQYLQIYSYGNSKNSHNCNTIHCVKYGFCWPVLSSKWKDIRPVSMFLSIYFCYTMAWFLCCIVYILVKKSSNYKPNWIINYF